MHRKILDIIEREADIIDDSYFDALFGILPEEIEKPAEPKKRGRPKGIKESRPRKPKGLDVQKILARLEEAIGKLRR